MIIAQMVGIRVFATGGIGGVHRGYDHILDISQDLEELSKTNVAVVCAGVKSILDIKSTLEYLETKSVPVYIIGSNEFPAFYTRESGIFLETKIEDLEKLSKIIQMKWTMELDGGVVIANPIPKAFSYDSEVINKVINEALIEAEKLNIEGKNVTPFLLSKIKEMTKGESLDANIELVKNNVRIATQLAITMTKN